MPKATLSTGEVERHDLETCPGGWVELQRLTYGQILARREMAGKFTMQLDATAGRRKQGGGQRDVQAEMQAINKRVSLWEFSMCIVDHNLEDDDGRKLDLKQPRDIELLHPKIGQEIDELISDMNNYDTVEAEGNSQTGSE